MTNTRYAMKYQTSSAIATTQAKSLGYGGPLVVAQDHMIKLMLPDVVVTITDGNAEWRLSQYLMHELLMEGVSFNADVRGGGCHFSILNSRMAVMLQDLDAGHAAGFDGSPIRGNWAQAVPKAARRFTDALKELLPSSRLVAGCDIIFDCSRDDANTGTFYDYMTPQLILGPNNEYRNMRAWCNLTPSSYHGGSNGGRDDDAFTDAIEQMFASVGTNMDSMSKSAQAAKVARWFQHTMPIQGMDVYSESALVMSEIERRAAPSAAERFQPLYKAGWREQYLALNELWPDEVLDVVTDTAALAVQLDIAVPADGITPPTAAAVDASVAQMLTLITASGNAKRSASVRKLNAQVGATDGDKDGVLSQEARVQLSEETEYTTLRSELAAIDPEDYAEMALTMMIGNHPAGILFINNKFAADKFWKEKAAARTESALQSAFNKAVSIAPDGTAQDWGAILPAGTGKKLAGGKFTGDWWAWLKHVIAKRDGRHTVSRIDQRVSGRAHPAFWTDAEMLRICEVPARKAMEVIRFGGLASDSFPAWYRMILRIATAIENLPKGCAPARGLPKRLEQAVSMGLQCAQDRFEAMLATPVTACTRVDKWAIPGRALDELDAVADQLKRIQQEVDDGFWGTAKDPNNNFLDNDDGGYKDGRKRGADAEWWADDYWKNKSQKREGMWGSATEHGIWSTPDHSKIAFGNVIVAFDGDEKPDLTDHCVACYAPGKTVNRHKWCPNPQKCWAASKENAHYRVDGLDDSKCKGTEAGKVDGLDWATFTKVVAKSRAANKPQAAPSGGRGGGGKGGKGGGGKGKGGKGKGKGGKGKGKGGKGKGNFQRQ